MCLYALAPYGEKIPGKGLFPGEWLQFEQPWLNKSTTKQREVTVHQKYFRRVIRVKRCKLFQVSC